MHIQSIVLRVIMLCTLAALAACDKDCSPATSYVKIAPSDTNKLVYTGKEILHFTSNNPLDTITGKGSTIQLEYNSEQDGGNCNSIQFLQEQRSVFFSSSTKNDFRIGIKTMIGEDPQYFISFSSGAIYNCPLTKLDGLADIDTLTINHHRYQGIYKIPVNATGANADVYALYSKSDGLLHLKLPSGQIMDLTKK